MYVSLADVRVPVIILVTPAKFTRSWANPVTHLQVILKFTALVIVMVCVWKSNYMGPSSSIINNVRPVWTDRV